MSEDEALAVLNQSPDGVLVVDENARILFASVHALDMFGYEASELIGQYVSVLSPDSLKSAANQVRSEIMSSPGIHLKGSDVPWFAQRKDGVAFPVETAVNVTSICGKKRLVYAIRDVTERHHLNDIDESCSLAGELSAAYARLRLFVRHAPAAIAMLNTEMRYISVSDRWLSDFGLGNVDLRGHSHYEIFPDIPEHWRAMHKRCLMGETFVNEADRFERADGSIEHLRWEIMPWKNAAGAIGGMMIFSEVITEKVRAEAELRRYQNELEELVRARTSELERVNAAKSLFLAAASHDLRQPLQAALTYLTVLRGRAGPAEAEICAKAGGAIEAARDVLSALLDLAELERGDFPVERKTFALGPVLDRVIDQFRYDAAAKGLRLLRRGPDVSIDGDPRLIVRVVANLVANAIRYTEEGSVTLATTIEGGFLSLAVADTGVGIAADKLESVFDEYVQLNNPNRDRARGYGLGLSIARVIAEKLGYSLSVQSTIGEGSTFLLSGAAVASNPPDEENANERKHAAYSVLLIEDDALAGDAMALMLSDEGFDVVWAQNMSEAEARVRAGLDPDLVITDFRLGDGDGRSALATVRLELGRRVPALLVSGDVVGVNAEGIGRCLALRKPFTLDELRSAIATLSASLSLRDNAGQDVSTLSLLH